MISFFLYSNFVFSKRFFESEEEAGIFSLNDFLFFFILGPINLVLSVYFFMTELNQLRFKGL